MSRPTTFLAAFVLASFALFGHSLAVVRTFTGAGDGSSFSDPANWAGGAVPDSNDDAVIPAGAATVFIANAQQVRSLSASRPVHLSGSLDIVTGDCTLNSTTLTLAFGSLNFTGGAQSLSGTGTIRFGSATPTSTWYGAIRAQGGGLTIAPGIALRPVNYDGANVSQMNIDSTAASSPTLLNGSVESGLSGAQGGYTYISGALNVGATGTIKAVTASAGVSFGSPIVNNGLVETSDGDVAVNNNWSGAGTFRIGNGVLSLGGAYTPAALSMVSRTPGGTGRLRVTGAVTNAGTWSPTAATGPIVLTDASSVLGGTLTAPAGRLFRIENTILNSVTIASDLEVAGTAVINGGLTLTGATVRLLFGNLNFDGGTQSLSGNGTIQFGDNPTWYGYLRATSNCQASIGPGITLLASLYDGINGSYGAISADDGSQFTFLGGPINCGDAAGFGGSISFSGQISNHSLIRALGPSSGISINGSFTNYGEIVPAALNSSVTFSSGSLTNPGTIRTGLGSVSIACAWSSTGILRIEAGDLNLGGAWAPADLGVLSRSGAGNFLVSAAVNNAGNTWQPTAVTGPISLVSPCVITGGALSAPPDRAFIGVGGTLDGLTIASDMAITGSVYVQNGLTLSGNSTVQLRFGSLSFTGSQTIGGNGTIGFGGAGAWYGNMYFTGGAATLAAGVAIRTFDYDGAGSGGSGGIYVQSDATLINQTSIQAGSASISGGYIYLNGGGTITNQGSIVAAGDNCVIYISGDMVNQGTIEPLVPSASVQFSSGTLLNNGTIRTGPGSVSISQPWTNAATLQIGTGVLTLGGTFSPGTLSSLSRTGNGELHISGTVLNSGTFSPTPVTGAITFVAGSTLVGGTLAGTPVAPFSVENSTFSGVTIAFDLTVRSNLDITGGLTLSGNPTIALAGGTLNAAATTAIGGTGIIQFGGPGASSGRITTPNAETTLTIQPGITCRTTDYDGVNVSGGGIYGTMILHGQMSAWVPGHEGGYLTFAGNFTNTGTIDALTPSSALYFSGILNNSGQILASPYQLTTVSASLSALTNSGTFTITPGSSFTVTGPFIQTASGEIIIQVGAPGPSGIGHLVVNGDPNSTPPIVGSASLAGTVTLVYLDGYTPNTCAVLHQFLFFDATVTGAFSQVNPPPSPYGQVGRFVLTPGVGSAFIGRFVSNNIADITGIGGPPAVPDGLLTGDDYVSFIAAFAAGEPIADITGIGGPPAIPDGLLTGDDFVAFINAFAQGCP